MSFEGYWIVCSGHEHDAGCTARSAHFPGATVDGLAKEDVIAECETRIREQLIRLQEEGKEFPPFESHRNAPEAGKDVIEMKFLIVEDYGHAAREHKYDEP